jgi:hypothetical protein
MIMGDKVWIIHSETMVVESGEIAYITNQGEYLVELDARGYAIIVPKEKVYKDKLEALMVLEDMLGKEYSAREEELFDISDRANDVCDMIEAENDRIGG